MRVLLISVTTVLALALFGTLGWYFIFPRDVIMIPGAGEAKSKEKLIAEALERSKVVKALYMTADVANDQGLAGTRLRNHIIRLADTTEINGIVIDVKEVCGPDYNEANIRRLVRELHQKQLWAIARIVVFKDASQIEAHPEWYLTRENPKAVGEECVNKRHLRVPPEGNPPAGGPQVRFWRDRRGGYWMDPANAEVQRDLLEFSKKVADLGFDELQFDYIRFPADGDVGNAIYPAWDKKTPKYVIMRNFFEFLSKNLKAHKPELILSLDLFGYAAILKGDVGVGQRLEDIGENFDYISFMVYPSHYYNGLVLAADPSRGLPAVNFSVPQARANPGVVVERSLLIARDFLDGKIGTSTVATSTSATTTLEASRRLPAPSKVRLRPWLEDFFHGEDQAAGRPHGVQKVKMQIEAAERVENHGWMIWNAANIYTEAALKNEEP